MLTRCRITQLDSSDQKRNLYVVYEKNACTSWSTLAYPNLRTTDVSDSVAKVIGTPAVQNGHVIHLLRFLLLVWVYITEQMNSWK